MIMHVGMALLSLVLTGCQPYGRWVYQETPVINACPGGRINQVKRTTDTHLGRVRQIVVNTDSCLE
jgi:Na+-translocating ferredoxin:NAD+ oxidoreductase RNF subunit RnfB